jgi:hypothetical protein
VKRIGRVFLAINDSVLQRGIDFAKLQDDWDRPEGLDLFYKYL